MKYLNLWQSIENLSNFKNPAVLFREFEWKLQIVEKFLRKFGNFRMKIQ